MNGSYKYWYLTLAARNSFDNNKRLREERKDQQFCCKLSHYFCVSSIFLNSSFMYLFLSKRLIIDSFFIFYKTVVIIIRFCWIGHINLQF